MTMLLHSLAAFVLAACAAGAALCLWMIALQSEWLRTWRGWTPLVRVFAVVLFLYSIDVGATKGPYIGPRLIATYLSIMGDGSLAGPTNTIASATQLAAVNEVNAQSGAMLATATQGLAWASAEIDALSNEVAGTKIAWLGADLVTTGANASARCDLIQAVSSNGFIDAYVTFNLTPSTAPIIPFEGALSNGSWVSFPSVSNSFPAMVAVSTPLGVSSCYVYRVSVPDAFAHVRIMPQTEVTFGGGISNAPLSVLGGVMVNNKIGRTSILTNGSQRLVFQGGALVGVL